MSPEVLARKIEAKLDFWRLFSEVSANFLRAKRSQICSVKRLRETLASKLVLCKQISGGISNNLQYNSETSIYFLNLIKWNNFPVPPLDQE